MGLQSWLAGQEAHPEGAERNRADVGRRLRSGCTKTESRGIGGVGGCGQRASGPDAQPILLPGEVATSCPLPRNCYGMIALMMLRCLQCYDV